MTDQCPIDLRKLRTDRGMSQIAMAHALGIPLKHLRQLEQKEEALTDAVVLKIKRAFGIDVSAFLSSGSAGR